MTYKQSLANIEAIKNFVSPLGEVRIFINFTSESEFDLMYYTLESYFTMDKLADEKRKQGLPVATVYEDENFENVFAYSDSLLSISYELITGKLTSFHNLIDRKPASKETVLNEFQALIRKLK